MRRRGESLHMSGNTPSPQPSRGSLNTVITPLYPPSRKHRESSRRSKAAIISRTSGLQWNLCLWTEHKRKPRIQRQQKSKTVYARPDHGRYGGHKIGGRMLMRRSMRGLFFQDMSSLYWLGGLYQPRSFVTPRRSRPIGSSKMHLNHPLLRRKTLVRHDPPPGLVSYARVWNSSRVQHIQIDGA